MAASKCVDAASVSNRARSGDTNLSGDVVQFRGREVRVTGGRCSGVHGLHERPESALRSGSAGCAGGIPGLRPEDRHVTPLDAEDTAADVALDQDRFGVAGELRTEWTAQIGEFHQDDGRIR